MRTGSEVRVGVITVLAILLMAAYVFYIRGYRAAADTYRIRVTFRDARGLQRGDPVRMDGVKDAFKQVPLGVADGSPTMSLRVFTLEPGGHTPQHAHPYEHVNYVIEGEGQLWSEDGLRDIRPGPHS